MADEKKNGGEAEGGVSTNAETGLESHGHVVFPSETQTPLRRRVERGQMTDDKFSQSLQKKHPNMSPG